MRAAISLVALAFAGGELVPLPATDEPLFHFAVRHDEVAALLSHFAGHTPSQTARAFLLSLGFGATPALRAELAAARPSAPRRSLSTIGSHNY